MARHNFQLSYPDGGKIKTLWERTLRRNSAVGYVGSSLTLHNPLFFVHRLVVTEQIIAMFLLVKNFRVIGMFLNVVHGQV